MPIDRSMGRNWLQGDLVRTDLLQANFLDMIAILLITVDHVRVQERTSGHVIARTNNTLQPGEYDVYCDGGIEINNERWVYRLVTHSISGRDDTFRDGVRARDRKCVISGMVNRGAQFNIWSGFEAVHIFPLESESYWTEHGYGRWIRDVTPGVAKISSSQNGFLLQATVHIDFDNYLVSVNPDDNYKIIVFGFDNAGIDGKSLDPVCRDPTNPHRVSDQLLGWHFRQSVLANMRGAGEPIFEHDFPPGTDMLTEIREGPYAQQRFEMEITSRLRRAV
ncbi:hypothetical protein EV426DRAFT_631589 [Tirmania nivea]|nr:hypothetical protein EV426DRAFT_631589 [Tirmania nivea]